MSSKPTTAAPSALAKYDADLIKQINLALLPRHIAIIMDGNGRWAASRHLPRVQGHYRGAAAISDIVELASDLGIGYLTLYAFSEENWARPPQEIEALMNLLNIYLRKELKKMMKNQVRLRTIGDRDRLPEKSRRVLEQTMAKTAANRGLVFTLALSYGGRDEIVRAVRRLLHAGVTAEEVTPARLSDFLDTADYPDPDLLIRTSGEMRVSNFLLWQIAYAEIYVTPTLWPDFTPAELLSALVAFQQRRRRFGGVADYLGPRCGSVKTREHRPHE